MHTAKGCNRSITVLCAKPFEYTATALFRARSQFVTIFSGSKISGNSGSDSARFMPVRAYLGNRGGGRQRCLICCHEFRRSWETRQSDFFETGASKIITQLAVPVAIRIDILESDFSHFSFSSQ